MAKFLDEKLYELSADLNIEFGAVIGKVGDGYGFHGLKTDFYTNAVRLNIGFRGKTGKWHTHPVRSPFSDPDLIGASKQRLNSYVSRGGGRIDFFDRRGDYFNKVMSGYRDAKFAEGKSLQWWEQGGGIEEFYDLVKTPEGRGLFVSTLK